MRLLDVRAIVSTYEIAVEYKLGSPNERVEFSFVLQLTSPCLTIFNLVSTISVSRILGECTDITHSVKIGNLQSYRVGYMYNPEKADSETPAFLGDWKCSVCITFLDLQC